MKTFSKLVKFLIFFVIVMAFESCQSRGDGQIKEEKFKPLDSKECMRLILNRWIGEKNKKLPAEISELSNLIDFREEFVSPVKKMNFQDEKIEDFLKSGISGTYSSKKNSKLLKINSLRSARCEKNLLLIVKYESDGAGDGDDYEEAICFYLKSNNGQKRWLSIEDTSVEVDMVKLGNGSPVFVIISNSSTGPDDHKTIYRIDEKGIPVKALEIGGWHHQVLFSDIDKDGEAEIISAVAEPSGLPSSVISEIKKCDGYQEEWLSDAHLNAARIYKWKGTKFQRQYDFNFMGW